MIVPLRMTGTSVSCRQMKGILMIMEQKFKEINWKEVYERGILRIGNLARINKVMQRALAGEAVKIAFLGGSITAGAAATSEESCYASLVYSWWRERFPASKVEYINAGVGATTSKFGVARVKEDVLKLKPDVVFVEFSVNDTNEALYQETFEGLIRTILLDRCEPAVFMFNNVFYDDGRNAQQAHNEIGAYYDLPIVSMKESLFGEIYKGSLKNTDISADNLHPNDFGHQLVAGVITNLLDRIYEAGMASAVPYAVPKKPLTANRYFGSARKSCRTYDPEGIGFVKDETVKNGVWDVFRGGWSALDAGSRVCFEVEGWLISAQYRKYAIHPAPIAKAVIDGDEEHAVILNANFDETWGDCLYLQDIFTADKSGRHRIEIILTDAVPEKEFYLASIITA